MICESCDRVVEEVFDGICEDCIENQWQDYQESMVE